MAIIKKKIWPEYFDLVAGGKKAFELRLGDFDIQQGDTLVLEEWDPRTKKYTGRTMETVVTYVVKTKNQKFWSAQDVDKHGFSIIQIEFKKQYPTGIEVVCGVVVRNRNNEVLMTRSLKWRNSWMLPGGHVEPSETILQAAKREGEEETGLKLKPVVVLHWGEDIKPAEYHRAAHFIFFHCLYDIVSGHVHLQSSELSEYCWMKPAEVMKQGRYRETMKKLLEYIAIEHSA